MSYTTKIPPAAGADKPRTAAGPDQPPPGGPTHGAASLVAAELARLAERAHAAKLRAWRSAGLPDREAAEAERREAEGELWAFRQGLADLGLMLLRYAREHRPEALCASLADALAPELDPLTEAVARLEGRR